MTILRGGLVVDGTGSPAQRQDVEFEGAKITGVGDRCSDADRDVIDVDGLVVCPGFIDCHTHYDAQVLWDSDLTPSSWHGVTTVVIGNCGFGIAPTAPIGRETIARTLENVEGMSFEALMEGIPWTFETFPQYLDAVESSQPALNVAAMVGHTPIRLYVMGEEASDREASPAEIDRMRELVLESLEAGAVGFASSRLPGHAGAWGKPVPSRLASVEELFSLAGALRDCGRGVLAITKGPDFGPREMAQLSEATGRPVTWTALTASSDQPEWRSRLAETHELGGNVWPQVACRPVISRATLKEPAPLARVDAFREVLRVPAEERRRIYENLEWRTRAGQDVARQRPSLWSHMFVEDTHESEELRGKSIENLARDRGEHEIDVVCEIALEDNLETRFRLVLGNDEEDGIAELLNDSHTILGLSDAGAHADQLCDAGYSTYMLEHWVRERRSLTLEKAIWRLTQHPAQVFGISGRGEIRVGFAADLVVFDPEEIAVEPERRVWDMPTGADRLVTDSRGIFGVWVNGVRIRDEAGSTGLRPGQLIRGNEGPASD